MLGMTGTASAATVTVGQTASKASSTYFYYASGATNAQVAINNAITAAAVGATATSPGVVNIENATKSYELSSHILAKSNVNIIGQTRAGVILKIAKGVSIVGYGGPGTTGWGGPDSAAADGGIINVWSNVSNVTIKNITFNGSCGDYYACGTEDRGQHRLVLMNIYYASKITVNNCKFTDGQDNGMWVTHSSDVEIENSVFDAIGHDFVEGWYSTNIKYHNNIGAMRTNSGVRCSGGSGTNCYVYDSEFYTGSGGGSGLELQNSFPNVKVYNNYFHDITPSSYGAIGYAGQSPTGTGHEYYNNLFVNMPYAVNHVPSSSVTRNNIMISCGQNVVGSSDQNNIKTESGYTFEKRGEPKKGNTYWIVKSGPLASVFGSTKIGIADGVAGGTDGDIGGGVTPPPDGTKYTLTVSGGTGGGSYASGTAVAITAGIAPSGQIFSQWTGDTSYLSSATSSSTTVTMPAKAIALTATYKTGTTPPAGLDLNVAKNAAFQMTSTLENSTTQMQFNYAENINDGRGITFGAVGFCTGTYDGNILVKYYNTLNASNSLAKYVTALNAIDAGPHNSAGGDGNASVAGLDGFIQAVQGNTDPLFKTAQIYEVDLLYWNPAVSMAQSIGAQYNLTLAFIYDMSIRQGPDGAQDIIDQTTKALGGTPKTGINETTYLNKLFTYRDSALKSEGLGDTDRDDGFKTVLSSGNTVLATPYTFTAYGDSFTIKANQNGIISDGGTTKYALTVTSGTGGGSYESGKAVTITANTASTGQAFDKWTGDTTYLSSTTSSSVTVTMPAKAITLTATYKTTSSTTYTLTVTGGTGGGAYASGKSVTVTATIPSGQTFSKWTGDTTYLSSAASSSATVTMPAKAIALTATFTTAPVVDLTGFPYPRGTNIPYGMMGWETGTQYLTDKATLVHYGWATSITPAAFAAQVKKAKDAGISKYLIATGGPEMNTESFWKSVKDLGVADDAFLGVYFPDEPGNASTVITMYNAMKKYYPKALAGDYLGDMSDSSGTAFIPGLDVCYFTTYTKFHPERAHAWMYGNLIANGPAWKKAGKTIWSTTEALKESVSVVASDPDLSTAQKVKDRHVSQIVMGILGGAQGVFSYAYKYTKGTPNYDGFVEFQPRYTYLWPWIMKGDRTLLTTNVTSGVNSITPSVGGKVSAVTAYVFNDASGKKLIASSSMLDFTESNGVANAATITGVPNGTYNVLWENRTVTVTDGTIKDTWQPYGYHFYELQSNVEPITKYTLTVNGGTGSGSYTEGTKVNISTAAPAGKAFDKWTGDVDNIILSTTLESTTVTMPAKAITLTATFKDVIPDTNSYGLSITGGSGSGSYGTGSRININATVATGKTFVKWTGDTTYVSCDTCLMSVVTMPAKAIALVAVFTDDAGSKYALTVTDGSGTGSYYSGSGVVISANLYSNKDFDKWTGDTSYLTSPTSATTTVTMPAKTITLTATYKSVDTTKHTLTVSGGTGSGSYTENTTVLIKATDAPSGKIFEKWTGDTTYMTSPTSYSATVSMPNKAITLTAVYKDDVGSKHVLTVNGGTGTGSYTENTTVLIKAGSAPSGKVFSKWTGDTNYAACNTCLATSVTMPAKAITLTAVYKDNATNEMGVTILSNTTTSVGRGTTAAKLISFKVSNTSNEKIFLTGIKVTGSFKANDFSDVNLYINDRNVGRADSVKDGAIVFNTLQLVMADGESFTFMLKGDITKAAPSSQLSFTLDKTSTATFTVKMTSGAKPLISISGDNTTLTITGTATPGAPISGYADGAIIRAKGDIDVYIVKIVGGKMYRRLILSPSVFRSYGHLKWENILGVDESALSGISTSSLVRVLGDTKVWKLEPLGDTGHKTEVTGTGYDPDSVYTINATDFNSYI
jgi:hypothetical protein